MATLAARANIRFGNKFQSPRSPGAAIASYPDQRFTLRNGIQVIRQHPRG
jgi:hypothetical protein